MKRTLIRKTSEVLLMSGVLVALTGGVSSVSAQLVPSVGMQEVSGKILSIDPATRVLRLEAEQSVGTLETTQLMEFLLAKQTIITEGVRTLQPTDLKTLTPVEVEYRIEGGKPVAHAINVYETIRAIEESRPSAAGARHSAAALMAAASEEEL